MVALFRGKWGRERTLPFTLASRGESIAGACLARFLSGCWRCLRVGADFLFLMCFLSFPVVVSSAKEGYPQGKQRNCCYICRCCSRDDGQGFTRWADRDLGHLDNLTQNRSL